VRPPPRSELHPRAYARPPPREVIWADLISDQPTASTPQRHGFALRVRSKQKKRGSIKQAKKFPFARPPSDLPTRLETPSICGPADKKPTRPPGKIRLRAWASNATPRARARHDSERWLWDTRIPLLLGRNEPTQGPGGLLGARPPPPPHPGPRAEAQDSRRACGAFPARGFGPPPAQNIANQVGGPPRKKFNRHLRACRIDPAGNRKKVRQRN